MTGGASVIGDDRSCSVSHYTSQIPDRLNVFEIVDGNAAGVGPCGQASAGGWQLRYAAAARIDQLGITSAAGAVGTRIGGCTDRGAATRGAIPTAGQRWPHVSISNVNAWSDRCTLLVRATPYGARLGHGVGHVNCRET